MMHISDIFDQCKLKLIAIRKTECMQIWRLFPFMETNTLQNFTQIIKSPLHGSECFESCTQLVMCTSIYAADVFQ